MSPYAASSAVDMLRINKALSVLVTMDSLRDQIASLVGLHRVGVSHSQLMSCKASDVCVFHG